MSLRARVALALALLAAAAVIVVSVTSYVVTGNSVHAQTDRSLHQYGEQLQDPDGHLASQLCSRFGTPPPDNDNGHPEPDQGAIVELPGAQVQCLSSGGSVTRSTLNGLPVSTDDRKVASHAWQSYYDTTQTKDGAGYRIYTVAVQPSGAVQIARSTHEADQALATVRDRALLVGAIVIALAAGAGWLLARRAAAPLSRLTATAERIAETGRPEEAGPGLTEDAGRDEIGRLARAFETMLAALTRARENQQRLAQDAGHELRTPLTSLRTNIETLRRHADMPNDVRARVLDDLTEEEGELQRLVEELVALVSDEDDGEEPAPVDLGAVVDRQVERARRRSDRVIVVERDGTRVVGRSRRLDRLVANLIDNAIKFSDAGRPIEVSLHDGVLTVRDHGPGFEPRDLPHVLDRFYRAENARSRPGSGLGLAIVDEIARAHGGSVAVANATDGGGAVVTVTLPVAGVVA
jgi:two-component system sensor histidine kinase MprB